MCAYEITPPESVQTGFGYSVGYYGSEKKYPVVTWKLTGTKSHYTHPGWAARALSRDLRT
jgi:hypothetical protein